MSGPYYDPQTDTLAGLGRGEAVLRSEAADPGSGRRAVAKKLTPAQTAAAAKVKKDYEAFKARERVTAVRTFTKRQAADKKLAAFITAGNFRGAWKSGLIPNEAAGPNAGKTPSPLFNWGAYRFTVKDWNKIPSNRNAMDIAPPWKYGVKAKPFTRADLKKILALYKHEDGGPRKDKRGDQKLNMYLAQQKKQLAPTSGAVQRGVRYHLPAFLATNTKEPRKIKDQIVKAVVIAGAATGIALLGNAIIAKVAAGGAKAAAAGAAGNAGATGAVTTTGATSAAATATGVGASTGGAAALTGSVGKAAGLAGAIGAKAKAAAPIAEKVINGTRTVRAVLNGEMPPPPISLGDGSFTDYATLVGEQLIEREFQRKLEKQEADLLAAYTEQYRQQLARYEPAHAPVVNSGLHPQLTDAQRQRANEALAAGGDDWLKIGIAVGLPIVAMALGG